MRIIAIVNHKGGCGKTTTSIHFSACLAHLGKKVLLVDVDPQGHSTCGLHFKAETLRYTLYDILSPTHPAPILLEEVAQRVHASFHVIPSYGILNAIEEELARSPDKDKVLSSELSRMLDGETGYDYVVLDCPPNLGILTFNALEACDEVIVPVEPSYFSLHGLAKVIETLASLNSNRRIPIEIHALLTIFNSRTCFAKEVYDNVRDHFGDKLFKAIIHESVALKEAASAGESIVQFAPHSTAFYDYLSLAKEYLEREWARVLPTSELGWNNAVHHRFGPRRVPGGVLFQAHTDHARFVELAGDFNNWIPESMIRRNDQTGLWQKVVPVRRGQFRYKYIIDGEWQLDPYQPDQRNNAFGTVDSYIELA